MQHPHAVWFLGLLHMSMPCTCVCYVHACVYVCVRCTCMHDPQPMGHQPSRCSLPLCVRGNRRPSSVCGCAHGAPRKRYRNPKQMPLPSKHHMYMRINVCIIHLHCTIHICVYEYFCIHGLCACVCACLHAYVCPHVHRMHPPHHCMDAYAYMDCVHACGQPI